MRLLKRNVTTFEYRAYMGKTEILTEDGKHTGRQTVQYDDPVQYSGNISVPSSYATKQLFGIDTNYTHVLVMDDTNADIEEDGLIEWNGNVYEVRSVRKSMNVLTVALRKRTKNKAE